MSHGRPQSPFPSHETFSPDPFLPTSSSAFPVWVFQGVNDPLNDAAGRAKQMEQAGAKVELVEGGHTPHDELPGLFNDFVASVAGGD